MANDSQTTFSVYARVVLRRERQSPIRGRIIQVVPFARHPYLLHLDDDNYTRAKGDELERVPTEPKA